MDWRVDPTTAVWLQAHGEKAGDEASIVELAHSDTIQVLQVKFQSHDHGAGYYNQNRVSMDNGTTTQQLEPDFQSVFASLWRIMFTPTHALSLQIRQALQAQQLVPGHYVAAHVRALYGVQSRPESVIASMTENAIRCAAQLSQLLNTDRIYVASDSQLAVQRALAFGAAHGVDVVTTNEHSNHQSQPLHLDKTPNWQRRPASDFMNVFVELYLLGLSRCMTYGMGRYGQLGSMISRTGASTCHLVHMNATAMAACSFSSESARIPPPSQHESPLENQQELLSPLFLPPKTQLYM